MIPAALLPILQPLLSNGLNLVANAVMAKGKKVVEEKLGVELKPDMSPEDLAKYTPSELFVSTSIECDLYCNPTFLIPNL